MRVGRALSLELRRKFFQALLALDLPYRKIRCLVLLVVALRRLIVLGLFWPVLEGFARLLESGLELLQFSQTSEIADPVLFGLQTQELGVCLYGLSLWV